NGSASRGAGIHAHNANVTLANVRVRFARAFDTGGAISLDASTAVVRNLRTENSYSRFSAGGAIGSVNGSLDIDGAQFVGAQSFSNPARGGAVFATGGSVRIRNARFESCTCSVATCLA